MILTDQESIFCQAIAMTSLLVELHNTDFLNSDYYKNNVSFEGNNNNIKIILKESGLGNPATMQMFLYILLVMPKEMLSCVDESTINTWANELKYSILSCNPDVTTTYPKENQNDLTSIDYYRHIRNAVSHSKCVYKNENNRAYVTFRDEIPKSKDQYCEIKMLTSDVGRVLTELTKQMMKYLNDRWNVDSPS